MKCCWRYTLFFATIFTPYTAEGSGASFEKNILGICMSTGYYMPIGKTFRENYQNRFFVGESSIPVALQGGVKLNVYKNYGVGTYIMTSKSRYINYPNMSIRIISGSIRLHYSRRISPITAELSIGPTRTWNVITASYFGSTEAYDLILIKDRYTNTSNGYSLEGYANIRINKWMTLGPSIAYYSNVCGAVENGGLGDLSGFLVGVNANVWE